MLLAFKYLVGMGRQRNCQKWRIFRMNCKNISTLVSLKLAAWNCNGLLNPTKMDSAIDGFESQALDILFLSETHLNLGNNVDLTCLNCFDWYSTEWELKTIKKGR